jgi:hypothetical protein
VLRDPFTAPVAPKLKALLLFIVKAARDTATIEPADVDGVRSAGWSDDAIYDAITVCALFRFYNTWIDATGVMPLPDYEESGRRLAAFGYAPPEAPR